MKREAREAIQGDKAALLYSILDVVSGLEEPLRQLGFALFCLHEDAARDEPEAILLRSINLHTEHFDGLLPPSASVTRLMRQFQLRDPHVTCSPTQTNEQFRTDVPLFEIVSSLELTGSHPRINWWVRPGQWSQWGLSMFDRLLLCRFARTAIDEKEPEYHRLLALVAVSVAQRVDEAALSERETPKEERRPLEISLASLRDDLVSLENMLNILPDGIDPARQTEAVVADFVESDLFRYTDESHEKVRVVNTVTSPNQ